jgi:hypothetical protein
MTQCSDAEVGAVPKQDDKPSEDWKAPVPQEARVPQPLAINKIVRAALIFGPILAVVVAAYGWWTRVYERMFPAPAPAAAASFSIECADTRFPVIVKPNTAMCGLILDKGKTRYACPEVVGTANVTWPRMLQENHNGFLCRFTNTATVTMLSASMWIRINYESPTATVRAREESISLMHSLEPDTPLDVHVFDDSGWDPLVVMPDDVLIRLQGEIQPKFVKVDYPTGQPDKLHGFGPA